ncbi:MAG: cupin domain-containing protein, partial [Acidobacteriota bacterium]|nr:cupin domain-containing protein [Acidobacteriota bacterium]
LSFLPLSVPQSDPSRQVREQLLRKITAASGLKDSPQVWKTWNTPSGRGDHLVRTTQGAWESVGLPGVLTKQLYVDSARESVTMLVRMEPGATYPAHRHGGREQCFVLEGDLSYDIQLHAGDFLCADADTIHPASRTEKGCLLLIISSTHDDLID